MAEKKMVITNMAFEGANNSDKTKRIWKITITLSNKIRKQFTWEDEKVFTDEFFAELKHVFYDDKNYNLKKERSKKCKTKKTKPQQPRKPRR